MHVKQITSTVKARTGKPWTFELGEKTLITGKNTRGKSRVSIAVQLALSGAADDILGRDGVKSGQILIGLAPPDGEVYAHATLSDDTVSAWGTRREADGTVKTPLFEPADAINVATVVPLRGIKAALAGNDETAKKSFLDWTAASVTEADVLARLPAHLHDRYRDIAKAQTGTPTERMQAVQAFAVGEARRLEADAAAQDALLESMGGSMAVMPSEAEVEQARTVTAQWEAAHQAAVAYEAALRVQGTSPGVDVSAVQAQLAHARAAVENARQGETYWRGEATRLAAVVEASRPVVQPVDPLIPALVSVLEASVQRGCCAACQAPSPHLAAWLAHYKQQVTPPVAAAVDPALAGALTEARGNAEGWRMQANSLQAEVQRLEGVLQGAAAAGPAGPLPPNPGVDAATAASTVQAARAQRDRLMAARASWDTLKSAKDKAAELRSQRPAWDDLAKACSQVATEILEAGASSFAEKVQRYLPETWRFHLKLRDGFEVGYVRDGQLHTIGSGAEWTALQCALAMAVAEMGGGATPKAKGKGKKADKHTGAGKVHLVVLDDRDRDGETLADLMRAWTAFPGQVIIESTKKPAGKMPAGWTHIDMDAWVEANEKGEEAGGIAPPPQVAPAPSVEQPVAPPPQVVAAPPAVPGALGLPVQGASALPASWWYKPATGDYYLWTEAEAQAASGTGEYVHVGGPAEKAKHEKTTQEVQRPAARQDIAPKLLQALTALGADPRALALIQPAAAEHAVRNQVPFHRVRVHDDGTATFFDAAGQQTANVPASSAAPAR